MAWRFWKPKNLSETIFPLTTLSAVLGFGVFQYPIGRPRMLISVAYLTVFSAIYWSAFVITTTKSSNTRSSSTATRNAQRLVTYFNQMTTLFAQAASFWYIKRQLRIVERLRKVDNTLFKLGVSFDYRQCFIVQIICFSIWFLLLLGHVIFRIVYLVDPLPLWRVILVTAVNKYPALINMLVGLTFWILAWCIGHKFYAVNQLLGEPYKHIYQQFESDDFGTVLQKKFHIASFNMPLWRHYINGSERKNFIQILKFVHLEMTLVTRDLNEIYGKIWLMLFAMDFGLFTAYSYVLYGLWARLQIGERSLLTISSLFWMAAFFLKIFLTNDICDGVINQVIEFQSCMQRAYHCN
ncbi:uncharacterized protein [Venturia canescens]|uniref:uncharacterized protein n=1 Tax=Venturia canescens TaxID=32260 RepID=UPI001C9C94F1|nr:uncharacterized protein LOC122416575 [Venturia canescens]